MFQEASDNGVKQKGSNYNVEFILGQLKFVS